LARAATKKKQDVNPERSCPLTGSSNYDVIEEYCEGDWQVVSCKDSGFVYLLNPPGYEALIEEYAWEKTSVQETERRIETRGIGAKLSKSSRWRLSLMRLSRTKINHYFENGNVLDIGCGAGHKILAAGGIPHGVEISKELNTIADERMRERGGFSVHAPAVDGVEQFDENYFDSVLMHSFLEHEENPSGLLAGVHRVLKPGGLAYVRVPNYGSLNRMFMGKKWCGFRYPDHVNYFTIGSLKKMAANNGFDFKLLNPLNVFLDDNIKALLVKRGN